MVVACTAPTDWVVFVSSASERTAIVRVDVGGAIRQIKLEPYTEGQVIALDQPPRASSVAILDAETCEILAAEELPAWPRALVTFVDNAPGISMTVSERSVGRSTFSLPEVLDCPP